MVGSRRFRQLDGLRGIAILMVFFYHAANTRLPLLWSGVDLFFVLSGYLITEVLLRLKERADNVGWASALKVFYRRRARRILPPYVGFLLAASLVYTLPWARIWYFYVLFNSNLPHILHIEIPRAMIPLWSLAVEEQFYFVWPIVVLRARPATVGKVAVAVILVVPLMRAICTLFVTTHEPIYFLAPFRCDTLACGAYIAIARHHNPDWIHAHRHQALRCAWLAGLLFCLFSISPKFRLTANSLMFNALGYSLIALIFSGALIYALDTQHGLITAVLMSRPLRYMGTISYTFYLCHWAVLSVLQDHFQSKLVGAIFGFGLSGLIASVSWNFLEAPILGTPGRHGAVERAPLPSGPLPVALSTRELG